MGSDLPIPCPTVGTYVTQQSVSSEQLSIVVGCMGAGAGLKILAEVDPNGGTVRISATTIVVVAARSGICPFAYERRQR